jgi:hypothetical protein
MSSFHRTDLATLESEDKPRPQDAEQKFLYAAGRPYVETEKTIVRSPKRDSGEACMAFRFSIFVSIYFTYLPINKKNSVDKTKDANALYLNQIEKEP